MDIHFFYLINLVMISRLISCFKDEPIPLKKVLLLSVIQLTGTIFVFEFNIKLVFFLIALITVNITFYFIEKKNNDINMLRTLAFLVYFVVIDIFSSPSINPGFNKMCVEVLRYISQYSTFLVSLSSVDWWDFNVASMGFLVIINEVNFLIRMQFKIFQLVPTADNQKKAKVEIVIDEKEYNAGRFIGILERIIIYIFILNNNYAAVGLIVAAKGFTRFKELESRKRAEYVLIGTLMSTLSAIAAGIITKILLPIK